MVNHKKVSDRTVVSDMVILSPYLFILCMESLYILISREAELGRIKGLRASGSGPIVTHLYFADDSTLFLQASKENGRRFKGILDTYCKASGQVINHDKSLLLVSPNLEDEQANEIKEIVTFKISTNFGIYLGLPADFGCDKKNNVFYGN